VAVAVLLDARKLLFTNSRQRPSPASRERQLYGREVSDLAASAEQVRSSAFRTA
jgi:hypothetical protein